MQEPSFSTEALAAKAHPPDMSSSKEQILDDQTGDQKNDQRDRGVLARSESENDESEGSEINNNSGINNSERQNAQTENSAIEGDAVKAGDAENHGMENCETQNFAEETRIVESDATEDGAVESQLLEERAQAERLTGTAAIEMMERTGELAIDTSLNEPHEQIREYRWRWKDTPIQVVYEVVGTGHPILLLPAFSSVSSREEMRGLIDRLSPYFQVYALDWVGFGESSRPSLEYEPKLYQKFLKDFVQDTFTQPVVVIAAGHTAGYVMRLAHQNPNPWAWIVLVAPTWRGPLPTMMGEKWRWFSLIRRLVRSPFLGQLLYALNTTKGFLRWMYRRHVFGDRRNISRELIQQKWRTTHQVGARFASAAFVTGGLDPVRQRSAFFDYFDPMRVPVLVVIGEQTPPRSLEEMEILAHFSKVQSYRMPGALSPHEEYPDKLIEGILPFLKKYLS